MKRSATATTCGSPPGASRRRARPRASPLAALAAGPGRRRLVARPGIAAQPARRADRGLYDVNLGVSWEIDLWGRIRRLNEAARADYLATEEARRGVSALARLGGGHDILPAARARLQLEIARRSTGAFQGTHDLFNRRLEAGVASGLETSSAGASLAATKAADPGSRAADRGAGKPAVVPPGEESRADPARQRRSTISSCRRRSRPGCLRTSSSGGPTCARPSSSSSRPMRRWASPPPTSSPASA